MKVFRPLAICPAYRGKDTISPKVYDRFHDYRLSLGMCPYAPPSF